MSGGAKKPVRMTDQLLQKIRELDLQLVFKYNKFSFGLTKNEQLNKFVVSGR